ncbi:MAG TPA: hypothetical protein VLA89_14165, partial [Gemmatimonadales bacterium]|nr:hypothetical protein [Gemmatimonadales bacterium]
PPGCNVNIIVIGVKVELHATGVPIDGFLTQYDFIGSPKALSPAGPAAAANEYVPRNSFLLDNFQSLEMSAGIEVCVFQFGLLPCAFGVPLPFVDISVNVGGAVFDWWDLGGDPLADEDYIDNNPWHFYPWNPLLHSFADHVLPFVP